MSGVFGQRFGPEVRRPGAQLLDELHQLGLRVLPGEVRVRLREAGLREQGHHRGPRERLGEEDRLGVAAPHLGDQPLPERDGLRVRVVDAVHRDPQPAPVQHDVEHRLPERLAVVRVPVEVVDVLVALGRVLGELDRPVGAPLEPVGMVAEPRDGRESTGGRGRARAPCRARAAPRPGRRAPPPYRAPDGSRRARPRRPRSPTGCRGRPAPPARRCSAPSGSSARSGGSAGGRRRRSRARRARGRSPSTPAKPPHDRGKSSYQALARARSRSTSTSRGALRPAPCRSPEPSSAAAARHSSTEPSPKRIAPSESSPARSCCPAATFRSYSSSHPAYRSTQATTSNRWRPGSSTVNPPA